MNQSTNTTNAFAITFYFFAATKCNSKKIIVLASHRTGLLTCTDTALNVNCFEQNDCKPGTTRHWTERRKADNSTFAIGGVSCSADKPWLMVTQSFVLRINISGKNPAIANLQNVSGQARSENLRNKFCIKENK